MRRWWRDHFCDNPLLALELGRGRWWRSAFAATLVFPLVVAAMDVARAAERWSLLGGVVVGNDPESWTPEDNLLIAESNTETLWRIRSLASDATTLVLLWVTARAWSREQPKEMRQTLGVTFLSVRHLMGARALLWLAPVGLSLLLLGRVYVFDQTLVWFAADRHSLLFMTRSNLFSTAFRPLSLLPIQPWAWTEATNSLLLIAAVSHAALRWPRPAAIAAVALGMNSLAVWALSRCYWWEVLLWGWEVADTLWWVGFSVEFAVTVVLWVHLPRHVARAYGMTWPPRRKT